jgi:hypothetical protein
MNFGATTENAPSQRYNKSVAVVVTITDNRATLQIAMLHLHNVMARQMEEDEQMYRTRMRAGSFACTNATQKTIEVPPSYIRSLTTGNAV